MILFLFVLCGMIFFVLLIQMISNMKLVGGNELGIVSGKGGDKSFRIMSGGRVFVIPLLTRFSRIDLTPHTIEVMVDSAIASGVIPLNVKATVSFAIASNQAGRQRAATRILSLAENYDHLRKVASDIIEGHLRDAIASMTPEQVMQDKDTLVSKMINVCKNDLENIGLEITTMNIADVDDHRLKGVDDPDLYIALLKRIQTANAQTKAREARALADAASVEQQEGRRAETKVREMENELQKLVAATKVRIKEEAQRKIVGVTKSRQDAIAKVAGIKGEIEAEKRQIEMLLKKYEAEIITPAVAEQEKQILESKADATLFKGTAQAEIDQLKQTLEIIKKSGDSGLKTYFIENFKKLILPFAETLNLFPVKKISVITGAEGEHHPISAIHPNAIEKGKNDFIGAVIAEAFHYQEQQKKKDEQQVEEKKEKISSAQLKKS